MLEFLEIDTILPLLGVIFFSFVLSGLFIPRVIDVAYKKNLVDIPHGRKIHTAPIPQLGGVAFPLVFFFVFAVFYGLGNILGFANQWYNSLVLNWQELLILFASLELLCVIGVLDDLLDVSYRPKFIMQAIAASLLFLGGLRVDALWGLLWLQELPLLFSYLCTLFVVVLFINAINLIDGIDGLASGLSSISLLVYGGILLNLQEYVYALVAFILLGSLLAFYLFNVYGSVDRKRKVFMGDTGSYTLGGILAVLSLKVLNIYPTVHPEFSSYSFIYAFAPLFLVCFDVLRVFIVRAVAKKNPFKPDKNHIHHLILRTGLSIRRTRWVMFTLSALYIAFNLWAIQWINLNILILIDLFVWLLIALFLSKNKKKEI